MRVPRIVGAGWLEGIVGGLWVSLAVYAHIQDRLPLSLLGWELVTFGALVLSLLRLRVGMSVLGAVSILTPVVDPGGVGTSLYIAMFAVIAAVRRGEIRWALFGTIVFGAPLAYTVFQRSGEDRDYLAACIAWVFVYTSAWVLGLAFRFVVRAETVRVSEEFRTRQLGVVADLHDMVARNLSIIVMSVESSRVTGDASDQVMDDIAHRARLAGRAVREIAEVLVEEQSVPLSATTPLYVALHTGVRELDRAGFRVAVEGSPEGTFPIPHDVDLAAGRMLSELLHNVTKHGREGTSVQVSIELTQGCVSVGVENERRERPPRRERTIGLVSVQRQAKALNGEFVAIGSQSRWVSRLVLPLGLGEMSDSPRSV